MHRGHGGAWRVIAFDPKTPQLRFASQEQAEACVKLLVKALPGSEPVWVIGKEVGAIEQNVRT